MELTKRELKIIKLLRNAERGMNSTVMAEALHVSDRTVRSDIKNINSLFKTDRLIYSNRSGYWLNREVLSKTGMLDNEEKEVDRLLTFLLDHAAPVEIEELADDFYVGVNKIKALIQYANKKIAKYHLHIAVEKRFVSLRGSEINKRLFISSMIYEDMIHQEAMRMDTLVLFDRINFAELKTLVNSVLNSHQVKLDYLYENNLILNIGITVYRIMNRFPVGDLSGLTQNGGVQEPQNAKLIQEMRSRLEARYQIRMDESNTAFLSILLTGFISDHKRKPDPEDYSQDQEFIRNMVKEALAKASGFYMIDIQHKAVEENLLVHIYEMLNRCRRHIIINNPLQFNIQNEYPYIYEVALYISLEIKNRFQLEIPESEISLIAVHIGFVIDQKIKEMDARSKINVKIRCGGYGMVEDKIAGYLLKKYKGKIKVLGKQEHSAIANITITTMETTGSSRNVVAISPFLKAEDYMKMDQAVMSFEQAHSLGVWKQKILKYIDQRFFFKNATPANQEECMDFLGSRLREAKIVDDAFIDSVKMRESLSSTCFFDSFAIPYGLIPSAKTVISVLIKDDGIDWDGHKIRIVVMLAINDKEREDFLPLYKGLVQFLCDYQKLKLLLESDCYENFVEKLCLYF